MYTESPTKAFMNNCTSKSFQKFICKTLAVECLFKKFEGLQPVMLIKQNFTADVFLKFSRVKISQSLILSIPTLRNHEILQLYYKRTPGIFQGIFLIFLGKVILQNPSTWTQDVN